MFASMNSTQVAGRKKLNTSFRSRFIEIQVDDFNKQDLICISKNIMNYLNLNSNEISKENITKVDRNDEFQNIDEETLSIIDNRSSLSSLHKRGYSKKGTFCNVIIFPDMRFSKK